MACDQAARVAQYFDGELDAGAAAAMERHVEGCPDCSRELAQLERLRGDLREKLPRYDAPQALRTHLRKELLWSAVGEATTSSPVLKLRRGSFWWGAVSGAIAAGVAALALFWPKVDSGLIQDLTNAHLRSLVSDHLLDVTSSDHHTVKPWFAGHSDISPPTIDLAYEGYPLIGGRVDFIQGHRAAVVVYRHGAHLANVFAWTDIGARLPRATVRNGYRVACWRSANLDLCAVSDMAAAEFDGLRHLLQSRDDSTARE